MNYYKNIPDIEERIKEDEFFYFIKKYKNIAFNYQFCGKPNSYEDGYKHIVIFEPILEIPEQWNLDTLKQYETCICFNKKMSNYLTDNKIKNIYNVNYLSSFNSYFYLKNNEFYSFKDKKNAILFLNKTEESRRHESDIYFLRNKYLNELNVFPLEKHVFSRTNWGNNHYMGKINAPYHSHYFNLKKISEYKFCLCFESTYHYFYSYDFMTERILNCFKSKTIPIYFGCYNIEDIIPKECFVDIRDFKDMKHLSEYILYLSENEYEYNKIINLGFNWYMDLYKEKHTSLILEDILNNLT